MTACVTCGDELHPERAQKYDYCTKPECQRRNAKGLRMVAVGVNKAGDQYVALSERTEQEMAGGRYKKQPDVPASARRPLGRRPEVTPKAMTRATGSRASGRPRRREWSETQERLATIYREMGLRPDQIAAKLGVSERLVTKILLAVTAHGTHRASR